MPIPMEIQHASEEFERFLADARDVSALTTRNQTYTMVQGVLQVFRRRLSFEEAIRFAGVLPPVLRAIFVTDWNPDEPRLAFGDRAAMTREAQSLRRDHNFAPDSCIGDVATALRRHVDRQAFDRVIATLPEGAAEFWRVGTA
ncbi:hypothetical protein AZL_d04560 (plasmid) [Azospirillum sp. B510]|uniref:DUF2267 domain-containing protein n=1 Tax=Azospirillum sp. (strain B510) TaxID=137722 RepID=UPI0001C4CE64|nr:DUF2267 domain-containing protein [Azospirillum sp. B510]BAI76282.1 hypothetical protein AZL_d04560 [Azospirillum sp. B510]